MLALLALTAYAIIYIVQACKKEGSMANISVRKLDEHIYQLLRIRAAHHGVSMEEEARQIIYQAVAAPKSISEVFKKHFGKKHGINLKLPNRRKPHEPMDFSE